MKAFNTYALSMTAGIVLVTQFLTAQYHSDSQTETQFLRENNYREFSDPASGQHSYSYTTWQNVSEYENKGHFTVMK